MTIGAHVSELLLPHAHENVKVGDSCFFLRKEQMIEAAVVKRQGTRLRVTPEDRSGDIWVACDELDKVVLDGAEELMSRAARIAEQKRIEEEKRRIEAERKAAEKREKEGYEAAAKAREDGIASALAKRAVPARDWCPNGKYNWTESPVLMDQTKDCYRIVRYEIALDLDYGAVKEAPVLDTSEVDALRAAVEERNKEREDAKKKAKKGKQPKKTKEQQEAEAAAEAEALAKEEEEDKKAEGEALDRAKEVLKGKMDEWKAAEAKRVLTTPPKYPPDLPPILDPPEHPANQSLYEKLLVLGHGGDRIFYTDGSMHGIPYVEGSADKVCKGGGQALELVDMFGFSTKTMYFKDAYNSGITLVKHDSYPEEDPASWIAKDEEKWHGEFRLDQEGLGTEDW